MKAWQYLRSKGQLTAEEYYSVVINSCETQEQLEVCYRWIARGDTRSTLEWIYPDLMKEFEQRHEYIYLKQYQPQENEL